jgi:hypothetical protein
MQSRCWIHGWRHEHALVSFDRITPMITERGAYTMPKIKFERIASKNTPAEVKNGYAG